MDVGTQKWNGGGVSVNCSVPVGPVCCWLARNISTGEILFRNIAPMIFCPTWTQHIVCVCVCLCVCVVVCGGMLDRDTIKMRKCDWVLVPWIQEGCGIRE
jgi:hypothetical protein